MPDFPMPMNPLEAADKLASVKPKENLDDQTRLRNAQAFNDWYEDSRRNYKKAALLTEKDRLDAQRAKSVIEQLKTKQSGEMGKAWREERKFDTSGRAGGVAVGLEDKKDPDQTKANLEAADKFGLTQAMRNRQNSDEIELATTRKIETEVKPALAKQQQEYDITKGRETAEAPLKAAITKLTEARTGRHALGMKKKGAALDPNSALGKAAAGLKADAGAGNPALEEEFTNQEVGALDDLLRITGEHYGLSSDPNGEDFEMVARLADQAYYSGVWPPAPAKKGK